MLSDLVTARHLSRKAVIYIRQSTPHQVLTNQESLRLQYALHQRARDLGWDETGIQIIDTDLGLSGATATHREGFRDLIARVTLGEVGIVLSSEVTRLARNCSDWYPLLDLCGYRQCLIGDRDGVYDPGSANGRLLLGLKGAISEVELHTLRGLLSKAERGELALLLPAGLARDGSGRVVKDPDREVQERIGLVFASFLELGSVGKVLRSFRAHALTVPRRDRFGEVIWRTPTDGMISAILKNPAYAGAFVYGRTRSCRATYASGKLITARCPMAEWKIVVKNRYPAYVGWEDFERIQAMLRDNHAEYARHRTRGVPREGAALLQGSVWCGRCGHKMTVEYKSGTRYVCNFLQRSQGGPLCQHLSADPIDARVVAAFFAAAGPAELETWERARDARRQAEEALDRAEVQQVERLRYQALLAERQFTRVDPDNRLVAAELEHRWEVALRELRRAEETLAHRRAAHALPEADTRGAGRLPRTRPAAARPLATDRSDPGAQEGPAALPDRQGCPAPNDPRPHWHTHRLAGRRGLRVAGRAGGACPPCPLPRRRDAGPAAGAGSTGGCRRRNRRPADPRRPSLGPLQLRPGAYGADRSTASPRAARRQSDTPASPPGVADDFRAGPTAAGVG